MAFGNRHTAQGFVKLEDAELAGLLHGSSDDHCGGQRGGRHDGAAASGREANIGEDAVFYLEVHGELVAATGIGGVT